MKICVILYWECIGGLIDKWERDVDYDNRFYGGCEGRRRYSFMMLSFLVLLEGKGTGKGNFTLQTDDEGPEGE